MLEQVNTQPKWGILKPQHLLEHLEIGYKIMSGQIQDFEIATSEKYLDQVHNSLYNYDKFPMGTNFPTMKKGELEDLIHPDLATAKEKLLEARQAYKTFYKEDSEAILKNMVFGELNKYESYLLERKHLNHHFEQFGIL
jgi:oxepin-CoA hydrolase / 3-oxo-5,6-dehydrosuberyl-CoA semialdehyde dehydrogenase